MVKKCLLIKSRYGTIRADAFDFCKTLPLGYTFWGIQRQALEDKRCNAAVDDNLYNLDAFALNVLCIIQDTMLFSVNF